MHDAPISKSRERWNNSSYRQKRIEALKKNITEIQEHKPETSDLVIIGTSYSKPLRQESEKRNVPIITISEHAEHVENPLIEYESPSPILALRINDILLNKKRQEDVKIELSFNCVLERPHTYTNRVKLTNEGVATLRYHWKRQPTHNPDLPVPKRHWIFFFDKNENLILPGQTVYLEFHFTPLCTGTSNQIWEMILVPNILKNPAKIVFRLWAIVNKYDNPEILSYIDHLINERVERAKFEKGVEKMWQSLVTYQKEIIVKESLTEKEYFYSSNFDKDSNLSKFPFKTDIIEKLKLFYTCVRTPSCSETWDLCIDSIVNSISKHNNFKEQNEMYKYLEDIIYPLKYHPVDVINSEYKKYKLVYNILVATVDTIETEACKYISFYGLKPIKTNYPSISTTYQKMHLWEDSIKKHYCEIPKPFYTCTKQRTYPKNQENITRPAKYYSERDERLISLDPMERHLLLKELLKQQEENALTKRHLLLQKSCIFDSRNLSADQTVKNVSRSKQTLDKMKMSHMGGSVLKLDKLLSGTIYDQQESQQVIEPQEHNEHALDKQNLLIFREILYIKTYVHLTNAIDDISSIIDFCNVNFKQTSLPVIKTMLDAKQNIDNQYSINVE